MSELCNNSACFSVEIKGTSDIYSSSKSLMIILPFMEEAICYCNNAKLTIVPSLNWASTRLVSILRRQESSLFMVNLISISNGVCSDVLNPAIKPVVDLSIGLCFARLHTFAHFLHTGGKAVLFLALSAFCAS